MRAKLTVWITLAALAMKLAVRKARALYHSPHITRGERWALRGALVLSVVPIPGPLDEAAALAIVVVIVRREGRRRRK